MTRLKVPLPKTLLARQGGTLAEIESSLHRALSGYIARVERIGDVDGRWFHPISAGKWSPAQLTDHLTRANLLYLEALNGLGNEGAVLLLPEGRFSEDGRMIAEVALPETSAQSRTELLTSLTRSVGALATAGHYIEQLGRLNVIAVKGGFFGPLTGLECLQLASVHIMHHTRQLPQNET